jgi:hypothetical protein
MLCTIQHDLCHLGLKRKDSLLQFRQNLRNDMMFWQIFAEVILNIFVFPKVFANIQYVQMCMAGEKARGCLKEFSVFAKI